MHGARATFITIKLANGRTKTRISDRTGHSSSDRIHNQERAARKVAELGLGDFTPLDEASPELTGKGGPVARDGPAPEEPEVRAMSNEVSLASAPPRPALARRGGPPRGGR
ncbi:hypothetical protein WMF31_32340 [Sorangium sp. So ce1036]|uniref:hypothetical protein n=1 Tax=Sorangium sp. So ce1036 TaxID=3133328 RepID=UPI003F0C6BB2